MLPATRWTVRAEEHRRGRARRARLPSAPVSEHPSAGAPATSGSPRFDERLSVPLWWYLPAIGVGVLLGAEIHMGYPGVREWIGYAVFVPLLVIVLFWLGRMRIQVTATELA